MPPRLPSTMSDVRCPPSEKDSSPELEACSQSPGENCPVIDSCSRQSSSWVTDYQARNWLREALLQGCLLSGHLALASQAGSPAEMEHLLLTDTCPELTACAVSEPHCVSGYRQATGTLPLQSNSEGSWVEASLY